MLLVNNYYEIVRTLNSRCVLQSAEDVLLRDIHAHARFLARLIIRVQSGHVSHVKVRLTSTMHDRPSISENRRLSTTIVAALLNAPRRGENKTNVVVVGGQFLPAVASLVFVAACRRRRCYHRRDAD